MIIGKREHDERPQIGDHEIEYRLSVSQRAALLPAADVLLSAARELEHPTREDRRPDNMEAAALTWAAHFLQRLAKALEGQKP